MKITIEADEHTASVEFKNYGLNEFSRHLRALLHTVWLPSQVDSIMPTEEMLSNELAEASQLGYDEGYHKGYQDNNESPKDIK